MLRRVEICGVPEGLRAAIVSTFPPRACGVGVKDTVAGDLYRVGLALADLAEPTRVLHRLPGWILGSREEYERTGDVPNAVFPCGLIHDEETGQVRLYYGAADTSIALATAQLDDLLAAP
jgi:predicted GH43/DUF377 family glycosyl hydrolase